MPAVQMRSDVFFRIRWTGWDLWDQASLIDGYGSSHLRNGFFGRTAHRWDGSGKQKQGKQPWPNGQASLVSFGLNMFIKLSQMVQSISIPMIVARVKVISHHFSPFFIGKTEKTWCLLVKCLYFLSQSEPFLLPLPALNIHQVLFRLWSEEIWRSRSRQVAAGLIL